MRRLATSVLLVTFLPLAAPAGAQFVPGRAPPPQTRLPGPIMTGDSRPAIDIWRGIGDLRINLSVTADTREIAHALEQTAGDTRRATGTAGDFLCAILGEIEAKNTRTALDKPTAKAVAEAILRGAVANMTGCNEPHGCMGVISSMACGAEAEPIKAAVIERRASSQRAVVDRFLRAKDEGDLPAHVDPQALTGYLFAILQGLAVQAGSGASAEALGKVVDTSMMVWPTN